MEQNIYIETKTQSQNDQAIGNAIAGINQSLNALQGNIIKFRINTVPLPFPLGWECQGIGRDGPPGCSLILSKEKSMKFNILIRNKNQLFTNN